jgi:hypothetical protein
MRQVAKPISEQNGINKALSVSVAKAKSIIGYPQEANTNAKLVNSGPPCAVAPCCTNPNCPTIIGILE